ncbi:MAG: hypothetical protein HY428_00550 [Candidatus Levybacteria bacterium]|nr:hypothetical protein [Candidatus Levybacteria bacterium]
MAGDIETARESIAPTGWEVVSPEVFDSLPPGPPSRQRTPKATNGASSHLTVTMAPVPISTAIYTDLHSPAQRSTSRRQGPYSYWTPERTEEEYGNFYLITGDASATALVESNRGDLHHAVNRYPGGFRGLKRKLNVPHADRRYRDEKAKRRRAVVESEAQVDTDLRTVLSEITRNSRGDVQWTLPGNTNVENLYLGISNIRGLFLEQFPTFDELFPRGEDGVILEHKREEAKRFVLDRLGSSKAINSLWGSATNAKVAPYFGGSYIIVIKESFRTWGLEFGIEDSPKLRDSNNAPIVDEDGRVLVPLDFAGRYLWATLEDKPEQLKKAIQIAAKRQVENGVLLTSNSLQQAGEHSLINVITKRYPGGLSALKRELGISTDKLPRGYWNADLVREEAVRFLQREGELTRALLIERGEGRLGDAINRHYPGALTQLKVDIGSQSVKKPNGYWVPERVRQEALKFLQETGYLSHVSLDKFGRWDLIGGINGYPGGMTALKEELGIPHQPRKREVEKSNKEQNGKPVTDFEVQAVFVTLSPEDKHEILASFRLYIRENPHTTMSVMDFIYNSLQREGKI